ncbi:MAG TPA: hypothetical protein VEY70_16920 [Metabacillus sp.]|nr:hypothetical protein [Metabacillus sp.]
MSEHKEFLLEKERIDSLYEQGFTIARVTENLSGAFVHFQRINDKGEKEIREVQIKMAEARRYFSTLLIMKK